MHNLYLFVGKSGSGKSTIARMLEKDGYKQLYSFTTRKKRNDEDKEHIFVSTLEFADLGDIVAYTFYNNNHYGATQQQVDEADIYVIDPSGVEQLLQKYSNDNRAIFIIYFDTSVRTRILRMIDRGDSDMHIVGRLLEDERTDWKIDIKNLMYRFPNKNIFFDSIDANGNVNDVYKKVLNSIECFEDQWRTTQMIICCDVDQVLNDLTEVTLQELNDKIGTSYTMEDMTDFNVENILSSEESAIVKSIFNSKDIWNKVKPLPGSQDGVQKLINYGHIVYFVTNNCPDTFGQKVDWIKRYFPFVETSKIIYMADKWMLKCDVMIEDCYSTLTAKPYYHRVLMDYPWNQSTKDYVYEIYRCSNWSEILDVINELNEGE